MTFIVNVSINMALLLEFNGNLGNTVWRKLTGLPAGKYYITAADSDLTVILFIVKNELSRHLCVLLF